MTVKICDRCGKNLSFMMSNASVEIGGGLHPIVNFDLCQDCNRELLNFLGYREAPEGHGDYIIWEKKAVN